MRTIKYFSIVTVISINLLLIPSTTFASWWNPTTWFAKKEEKQKSYTSKLEAKEEKATTTKVVSSNKIEKTNQETVKPEVVKKIQKVGSPNPVKKQVVEAGKQKCLNGLVILTNETCTKTCPNGEIIQENLTCKTKIEETEEGATPEELAQLQKIADRVVAKYKIKSDIENIKLEQAKNRAEGTGKYEVQKGVYSTVEQILGVRKLADRYYENKILELQVEEIRLNYSNDPTTAQKLINDLVQSSKILNNIDDINTKLNSINSKQNQIQECIKDLKNGLPGYGCN